MAPEGGFPEALDEPVSAHFTAEVIEAGRGVPSGSCMDGGRQLGEPPTDFDEPDARWFRVLSGDQSHTVAYLVQAAGAGPAADDLVELDYVHLGGGGGHLELRSESGALRVWVGQAPDVVSLSAPPELVLEPRSRACTRWGDCARAQHPVNFNSIEGEAVVQPGEAVELGRFVGVNGGVSTGGDCEPDRALLALVE